MKHPVKHVDVLVRGAGIVGQSLALSLARLGLQVGLRSDEPRAHAAPDVRAYALNAASVALLKGLKVWDSLPAQAATPVYDMHVQGDAQGAAIDFSAWEQQVGELAWIVDAPVLERELGAAIRFSPHVHLLGAEQADHVKAELTALCEGKASASRAALGVRFERHDYGHSAIAARLVASQPHQGTARQWFRSPDVLALLPFDAPQPERSYALVWSVPRERAKELMALDDTAFAALLTEVTQGEAGDLQLASARAERPPAIPQASAWSGPGRGRLRGAAHPVPPPGRRGCLDPCHCHARALEAARRREAAAPLHARTRPAHLGDGPGHRRPAAAFCTAGAGGAGTSQPRSESRQPSHPLEALAHRPGARRLKAPLMHRLAALALALTLAVPALAQEAVIRKNLAERLPDFPKLDEITKSPIPGLYEVRIGTEIFYTDEQGNHIIDGSVIDTRTRANLTQARIDKLTQIDFAKLPLNDAIVWKQGSGERKMAVFADPNCGYCKRFERDLSAVKNVTVYTFLYPILGADSIEKSKNIWCAKDRTAAWRDWMLEGAAPAKAMGQCDVAALQRNTEFGRKYRINGTPGIVFEDGKRSPGAMNTEQIEKQLLASRAKP